MLARTGNMKAVYDADYNRRQREIDDAETSINVRAAASSPLEAEILPGAKAEWYLVQTYGGDDLRAMRWLARRRFGVFRPMQQRKSERWEGQSIGMREAIFPGWLFVFVWGMDRHQLSKVRACPGVMDVLREPSSGTPVVISDDFIEELRAEGWVYDERLGHSARTGRRHENRRKQLRPTKLGKKERKSIDKLKKALKVGGKFDSSTWARASELAPAKRIALLMQALRGPAVEGGAVGA